MFMKVHTPYWHQVLEYPQKRFVLEQFAVVLHSIDALEWVSMSMHSVKAFLIGTVFKCSCTVSRCHTGTVFSIFAW